MNKTIRVIAVSLLLITLTGCFISKRFPIQEDAMLKKAKQLYSKKTKEQNVDPILVVSRNYSFPYSKILWDYYGEQEEMKYEGEKPGPNRVSKKVVGGFRSGYYGRILYLPIHHEDVRFYFKSSRDTSFYVVSQYNDITKQKGIYYKEELCNYFNRIYIASSLGVFGYKEGKLYKIENAYWDCAKPLSFTLILPKDSTQSNNGK